MSFWYTFQRSGLSIPFANIVVVSEFELKSNSNWYIWVHRHIVASFTHLFYIFSLLSERMLGFSKWPCIVIATGREITSLLFLEFIPHYKLSWPATRCSPKWTTDSVNGKIIFEGFAIPFYQHSSLTSCFSQFFFIFIFKKNVFKCEEDNDIFYHSLIYFGKVCLYICFRYIGGSVDCATITTRSKW